MAPPPRLRNVCLCPRVSLICHSVVSWGAPAPKRPGPLLTISLLLPIPLLIFSQLLLGTLQRLIHTNCVSGSFASNCQIPHLRPSLQIFQTQIFLRVMLLSSTLCAGVLRHLSATSKRILVLTSCIPKKWRASLKKFSPD